MMSALRSIAGVPKSYKGFLWSKILDAMVGAGVADGDLLLRAGGVWGRKAIGDDGQFLKVVSGAPDWADVSSPTAGGEFYAAAYQAADLVIDNTTTGTTFVDTDLLVTLANGTYEFSFLEFTLCHATPDLKAQIQFTGTASEFKMQGIGLIETDTRYFNSITTSPAVPGTQTTTAQHNGRRRGTIVVTSPGDLSEQVAQNSASATPITFYRGGALLVWKIA